MAESGFAITWGIAEITKMTWPMMAIMTQIQMVRKRPRYVSATKAPKRGVK